VDWQGLSSPEMDHSAGVRIGESVRLLGFDAPALEAQPGATLRLDAFWLALEDGPEAAAPVFQLTAESGQVLAEVASAPAGGQAPLSRMEAGQLVRDPVDLELPDALLPGVYNLVVGRRRADGSWLPVRRGLVPLGSTYSMATIWIREQQAP
jgi:hypothetical protein